MKRGLVIGKFMPLHQGHIGLIRFAASRCDELILSFSYTPHDPIPGGLRWAWLQEEFKNDPNILLEKSLDDFDDESLTWAERIPFWVSFLKNRFPQIDAVFSSERYGFPLAAGLGTEHILFDPERKIFPISGSAIRQEPMKCWDFIARPAQSYFVKKLCFYGPESTGKSVMAEALAKKYNTEFVPEVAREIVSSNEFTVEDILKIGRAQAERVREKLKTANKFLFCDTDLITTQIYCRHYLGIVPPELLVWERETQYDQYFLFDIDVPWVADNLRDLGERRQEMYEVFRAELDNRHIAYVSIQGPYEMRAKLIEEEISKFP